MRFSRRSISSAPVMTRRTAQIFSHFSPSASLRHSAGISGKLEVNGAVLHIAMPRKPRLLRRKAEERRKPSRQAFEQRVQAPSGRAPLHTRMGLAIERVLADVEVDRRKVVRAELRDGAVRPLEIVVVISARAPRHRFRRRDAAPSAQARASRHARPEAPARNARDCPSR